MRKKIHLLVFLIVFATVSDKSFADCPSSSDVKTAIQSLVQEKKEASFSITTTSGFLMNKKTITQKGKLSLNKTLAGDFKVESALESATGCKYYITERGQRVGSVGIFK
jgi:hypothetical protein